MGVQVVGGVISNSLALISDAAHMLTDSFSLGLSWFALKIAAQPSTSTKTYGYHRMEIFAAFINGLLLLAMALGIAWQAYERFQNPQEVQSVTLIWVALIGLAANLAVIYFLKDAAHANHGQDLNVKGAFFHVLGDTLSSVAVISGGLIMWFTNWYLLDSIIAISISLFLIHIAKKIIADSVHILLEGVPKGISLSEVKNELSSLPEIQDIHELHIWCICSNIYALSTHALIKAQKIHQAEKILQDAKRLLQEKFNITHSTIQFEINPCGSSEVLCNMKH